MINPKENRIIPRMKAGLEAQEGGYTHVAIHAALMYEKRVLGKRPAKGMPRGVVRDESA